MQQRPDAPFGPVLTAIITPFTSDGDVDYAAFWRLIRHLGDNGSNGIVVAGTTGESPTLSKPEKVALFKAAVDACGDSMKVVAGVGTYGTTSDGTLFGVDSLDMSMDLPGTNSGLYYVVRPLGCGSWQTVPNAEPERDAALP